MAINMMCMNDKCEYYYEDNCMKNLNEERIEVDEAGKCETFKEGTNELYELEKIKVYKMNDYEWWASKWSIEKTNEYYKKEYGLTEEENPTEEIEECDLDKEGMWWEIDATEEEIKALGDKEELIMIDMTSKRKRIAPGSLKRCGSDVYRYITLGEAITKENIYFVEPYCIATTEW